MAFSPPETLRAHPGISISSLSAASRYRCSADKSYDKNCRCHWLSNASGCMVRKAARPLGLRTLSTSLSHCRAENLSFRRGDVSQPLALADEFADVVTGFMVLHN